MKSLVFALVSGLVFGVGLLLAGMTQPSKVAGFLDLSGAWDPSLGMVMAGAIGVHFLAYRLVPRLKNPVFAPIWRLPTRSDIDRRLVIGAVLFGAGWGLGGYCPGPALTAAVSGASSTLIFCGGMLAGMALFTRWEAARAS
jgi:uncharacterized membrane protein YedE/YeeE